MREGSGLAVRRGGWITLYELMVVCAALALFLPTAGVAVAQICAQRDRQADRLRCIEEAARLFDCLQADAIGASGAELNGGLPFSFEFPDGGRVEYREEAGKLVRSEDGVARPIARTPMELSVRSEGPRRVGVRFVPAQAPGSAIRPPGFETALCLGEGR